MAYIIIDNLTFDIVLSPKFLDVTTVAESGFINSPIELQSEIWNRNALESEYTIRCTHAEFWSLIQKFLAHSIVELFDSKKNIMSDVWIIDISEIYEISSDKYWLVTLSITNMVGN
jgi:hypothetical protein